MRDDSNGLSLTPQLGYGSTLRPGGFRGTVSYGHQMSQSQTVSIIVLDKAERPVPGIAVQLQTVGGTAIGSTGTDGIARLRPVSPIGSRAAAWVSGMKEETEMSFAATNLLSGEFLFLRILTEYVPEPIETSPDNALLTLGALAALGIGASLFL